MSDRLWYISRSAHGGFLSYYTWIDSCGSTGSLQGILSQQCWRNWDIVENQSKQINKIYDKTSVRTLYGHKLKLKGLQIWYKNCLRVECCQFVSIGLKLCCHLQVLKFLPVNHTRLPFLLVRFCPWTIQLSPMTPTLGWVPNHLTCLGGIRVLSLGQNCGATFSLRRTQPCRTNSPRSVSMGIFGGLGYNCNSVWLVFLSVYFSLFLGLKYPNNTIRSNALM